MAASGHLKTPDPCSVFDESVLHRTKNGKFTTKKQPEKSLSGTKLAENGRKTLKSERRKVRSAAPHHEKRDDCDR